MTGLLQRDPSRRLGANGGEEIKRHPFFSKYIDWNRWDTVFPRYRAGYSLTNLMQTPRQKDPTAIQAECRA
jgi:hypothetical protein